jgi:hypothetical protein
MLHPLTELELVTLHLTAAAGLAPEEPLSAEWETYRRELPGLLQEGHERKFVLIQGDGVIGLFHCYEEARAVGRERFPSQPCMVAPVLAYEHVLRAYWSYFRSLMSYPSPGPPFPVIHRSEHPLLRPGLPTIHHTQVPEPPADDPLSLEWHTYHRELPRLLREGHERKFALVKGDEIIGIFHTYEEATAIGSEMFLMQPFMVTPVLEHEPLFRLPWKYSQCLS